MIYREISPEQLKEVMEEHGKWRRGEDGGKRVDLSGANLSGADLSVADLSGANLSGANLYQADLSGANLSGADLSGANLYRADLSGADLSGANLSGADLSVADLSGANLSGANLSGADLYQADLSGANLYQVLNINTAINLFVPFTCPSEGSFIAWKKCRDHLIVKLLVPGDAIRSSATGRKCRCSSAAVLAIENEDGTAANAKYAVSGRDSNFIYRTGETVCVENFDENRWNECAPGIHFFITREEAVRYEL